MAKDVLYFITKCASEGKKVALVTVTATNGSSPATSGQMIAVLADGSTKGTVGGGASEHKIIQRAIEAIKNGENVFSLNIEHSESGMTCGGSMEVFGNIIGNQPNLLIFGGGHISQCLARVADHVGFNTTIIEDREELSEHFDSASYIVCKPEDYEKYISATEEDYAVICTRGHSTDTDALRYCIIKDFKYIGMIGSKKKVCEIYAKLTSEGVEISRLNDIYAPIGLDIASASPEEISVAITAEILLIKNKGKLCHKKQ